MKVRVFLVALLALMLATVGVAMADNGRSPSVETVSSETGFVRVIHGVPGLTVDVYVNGALTLPNFAPETITDPIELPTGNYDIAIVPAGGDPASPVISGSVFLPAGVDASVVAHLAADGTPTLSVFVNDVSAIAAGDARLTARHTAAAPAVDIKIWDRQFNVVAAFTDVTNGLEGVTEVDASRYYVTLSPAGTNDFIIGPAKVPFNAGQLYIAYAIGSLADGTFKLIGHTIDLPTVETGRVTVVHGVPGLVVDVYVNGALFLPGFAPETITDQVELPTGNYDIAIVAEGGDPAAPVISGSVFLPANVDASLVAHLAEDGTPTLSVFIDDYSAIAANQTRVVVRHTAVAPAVDVKLWDRNFNVIAAFTDLTNGNGASGEVTNGRYYVTLSPAGTNDFLVGPAKVFLGAKQLYTVYAIGSLDDGTFTLIGRVVNLNAN